MSKDRVLTKRTTYNFIDWIKDIGGFFTGLNGTFFVLSQIFTYDAVFYLLTPTLFEFGRKRQKQEKFLSSPFQT